MAVLPPEDGAIVEAAVEAAAHLIATLERNIPSPDRRELAGEHQTHPMLRADALIRVCEAWVASDATTPVVAPTTQVVVHVDADALDGQLTGGRSRIENGPWLSPTSVRWLSCDADVVTVTEREGLPIDVGRVRRLITPRLRLAMQSRDAGCRYPGCSVPSGHTDGHHVQHWHDGGPTNLSNLVSLCRFHHRRHHEGRFRIEREASGDFTFLAEDGRPLVAVVAQPASGRLDLGGWNDPELARARDGGAPFNREYAVAVMADGIAFNRAAAANVRAGPGT